ncbi:polymer-forming cytoskeletal protein [bacterium]|nr:polymer-forming cytoskeletal protein [bacterium]
MFGKNEDNLSQLETIVGPSVFLKGKLKSDGTIKIQGKVSGEIKAKGDILADEGSDIKAIVQARNIVVSGEVTGDLDASGEIELTESAKVYGNIACKSLVVKVGAVFIGKSAMKEIEDKPKRSKAHEIEPEPEIDIEKENK